MFKSDWQYKRVDDQISAKICSKCTSSFSIQHELCPVCKDLNPDEIRNLKFSIYLENQKKEELGNKFIISAVILLALIFMSFYFW